MSELEQKRFEDYQNYLRHRQRELIDPMGSIALASITAPLGVDVPRIQTTPEHSNQPVLLEGAHPFAVYAVKQEVQIGHVPPIDKPETYLGHAAA